MVRERVVVEIWYREGHALLNFFPNKNTGVCVPNKSICNCMFCGNLFGWGCIQLRELSITETSSMQCFSGDHRLLASKMVTQHHKKQCVLYVRSFIYLSDSNMVVLVSDHGPGPVAVRLPPAGLTESLLWSRVLAVVQLHRKI